MSDIISYLTGYYLLGPTGVNDILQNGVYHGLEIIQGTINKTGIFAMPKWAQWTCVCITATLLVVGSYFKSILYKHMYHKFQSKQNKSVDILILTAAVIQHVGAIFYVFNMFFTVWNDLSILDIFGQWYCLITVIYLSKFEIVYTIIGRFGLAIFRTVLILKGHLVKKPFVQKFAVAATVFGGLLLTAVIVLTHGGHTHVQKFHEQTCMHPSKFTLGIFADYDSSRGNDLPTTSLLNQIQHIGLMLVLIAEITMYISFFHKLYKNDNNEQLKRLLGADTIKQRNRENAITFLGQVYGFVFQMAFMVFIVLLFSIGKNSILFSSFLLGTRTLGFALFSIVEVMTSEALKAKLL